jgi:DNA adenine methylase
MTSYHGGKQRIGAKIAQIIYDTVFKLEKQTGIRFKGYVEPFCGMLGVYQHIPKLFQEHNPKLNYRAGDINESVIQMWNAVKSGWEPPSRCSKKRFYELKGNGESSPEKGFVGHACSYRSLYFSSYFDQITPKRLQNIKQNIINISELLKLYKVKFVADSYIHFSQLKGYIIYCDPPYFKGSNYIDEYHVYRKFDYKQFYLWVEKMSQHNLVFISERAKLPYKIIGKVGELEKIYLVNSI